MPPQKILIAPGAFKHSLTAVEVAEAIESGLIRSGISAELMKIPIADGGNGTLDAFLTHGGRKVYVDVLDPLQRPIKAAFGMLDDDTAIIEMALASGIELISVDDRTVLQASTYGTGQLMQAALDAGAKRAIVGLGGSATVDGGAGCMQALGVRFLDAVGMEVTDHGGGSLGKIAEIDVTGLDPRWDEVEVIIASDVENVTLGIDGSRIFSAQKGATPEQEEFLEENLQHYFEVINQQLHRDVRKLKGGGAAGAFSAGLVAFLNGKIQSGIDLILHHNKFEEHLQGADLVITGEGKMDNQTIYGKGPMGVARLAKEKGVPTIALVGGLDADSELLHNEGLWAVFPVVPFPVTLDEALTRAEEFIKETALRIGYILTI